VRPDRSGFPKNQILKNMNKLISLVLFIGGIILVIYSMRASDSISSSFSRFFTGSPTDKTIWLLISGIVASALGAGGLLRGSKSSE
jgi:amino acid permease